MTNATTAISILVAAVLIFSSAVSATSTNVNLNLEKKNISNLTVIEAPNLQENDAYRPSSSPLDLQTWLYYHLGQASGVGLTAAAVWELAMRLTPTELAGYDGYSLNKVKWYVYDLSATSIVIKIYDAGTTTTPGSLLTSQPYTATTTGWTEVPITVPPVIDATKDIWVSIEVDQTAVPGYPGGTDLGPAVLDKGGFVYFSGGWNQLVLLGLDRNWCIEAQVEDLGGPAQHDVGVISIDAPSSGGAGIVAPEVTVMNMGNSSEVTDVQFDISKITPPVTLWSYGFEDWTIQGFVHPGWTNVRTVGTDPDCYWQGHDQFHYIYPDTDPYAGTVCALVDTGYISNYGQTRVSRDTPFDFQSTGGTVFTFEGWFHKRSYGGSGQNGVIEVQISTDYSTWTTAGTISMYDPANLGWQTDEVDLTPWANEPVVYIAFLGIDGGFSDMLMDEVSISYSSVVPEYSQTVTGVSLAIGETKSVTFPLWVPSDWQISENIDIDYVLDATTLLADENPANDAKTGVIEYHYPYLHDIEVTSIENPRGTPAQTLPVEATITNVGQNAECCHTVTARIGAKQYIDKWQSVIHSGTGEWIQMPYSSPGYQPPSGTGLYFAGCDSDMYASLVYDCSLFTYALDLTGETSVAIDFDMSFVHYITDWGEVNTYSGGMAPSNFEQNLATYTASTYQQHQTFIINPSTYSDPSEVYVEFYYTTAGGTYQYLFKIDDVTVTPGGLSEGFEGTVFPPGTFGVLNEYTQSVMSITLEPGESTSLTFPDWTPAHLASGLSDVIDYEVEVTQNLPGDTNPANDVLTSDVTLDYWHDYYVEEITAPSEGGRAPGDILWNWDAETATGDNQCLGVEVDDDWNVWVTGGNTGGEPNQLYKLDINGNLITQYAQSSSAGWGWRDLAYDGTYLYGSDSTTVVEIDPATGLATGNTIPGPVSPCRALAYDPDTDHFWTASFSSDIFEFDRTGAIINTYSQSLGGIYGMAWDDMSDDGPWLWVHNQGGSDMHQMDPATGTFTGLVYSYTQGIAGGAAMIDKDGLGQLIGLTQGTPDEVFSIEICETGPPGAPDADIFLQPGSQSIACVVENGGTFPESGMNVNAQIYEYITNVSLGMLVYDENYTCGTLAPLGGQETATFPAYTFPDIGGIYLLIFTITPLDDYENNNVEELGIGIDNDAPQSSHTITPATPDGLNDWYISDVTLDFTADDGTESWQSGVDHIEYRLNGGTWQTGNTITVTTDGEHDVDYKAIDEVGNEETPNSVDFKIDQTIPNVDLMWESPDNVNVDFTADCSDDTSGMDYVEFYLNLGLMFTDNSEPYEWSIVWSPSLKTAEFTAKAFDMAGHFNTDMETGIEAYPVPHATPTPQGQQTNPL